MGSDLYMEERNAAPRLLVQTNNQVIVLRKAMKACIGVLSTLNTKGDFDQILALAKDSMDKSSMYPDFYYGNTKRDDDY